MAEGSARTLIVDDTPENLRLMQALFENKGMDALPAESGQAALAQVRSHLSEIVLLDMKMPAVSGLETLCKGNRAGLAGHHDYRLRRGFLRLKIAVKTVPESVTASD
jgi:DNA-binding NtrC family response regulator